MYDVKSLKAEEFISDEEIKETLAYADANKDNMEVVDAIIAKAKERKGLTHREASVLLACENEEKINEVYELAQHCAFCTTVSVQLLCQRMCILSISHEKQAYRKKEADTGRNRERSYRFAGYGT